MNRTRSIVNTHLFLSILSEVAKAGKSAVPYPVVSNPVDILTQRRIGSMICRRLRCLGFSEHSSTREA